MYIYLMSVNKQPENKIYVKCFVRGYVKVLQYPKKVVGRLGHNIVSQCRSNLSDSPHVSLPQRYFIMLPRPTCYVVAMLLQTGLNC